MTRFPILIPLSSILLVLGCEGEPGRAADRQAPIDPDAFVGWDSVRILSNLQVLSHDSLEGRQTGTRGGLRAREYLRDEMEAAGVEASPAGFVQPFEFRGRRDTTQLTRGGNVVGYVPGREPELGAIVVTAHFDHLGIRGGRGGPEGETPPDSIFNGADDNASGTAALLSMARYFARYPPRHTMVFAAVDAEEMGLRGSRFFVEAGWPEEMALNVNLDMVARSDSLLFAAGTSHYPHLRPILEGVESRPPVRIRFGHDRAGVPGEQDWTRSSDHRPFHDKQIPFVYFGVEDHPDYHRASDEFERIDPRFFLNAVRTILDSVLAFDLLLEP